MQRLCVDGYVRESENEFNNAISNKINVDADNRENKTDLNGLIIPIVINGIINNFMPCKAKWEFYYEHGRYWDDSNEKQYSPKGSMWE